jgi:Tol biopolymer transport system component
VRQLESTKFMLVGPPSPDGAWLPASNWPQFALDIVLLDAVTGQPRAEPKPTPDDSGGLTLRAVFSPDGRQLAYDWLTFPSPRETIYELRILDVATLATRTLQHRGQEPIGWSSDGNRLLVRSYNRRELAFIDVANGTISTVGRLPADPLFVSFSPDREQAVFDQPASAGSTERDIFIADLAVWRIRPLVQHPAMDAQPVWLPDGSGVLFASDRAGSLGLWRLDVIDGKPSSEPRLVRPNVGRFRPLGFHRAGDLYYKVTGPIEVYTADVDLQQGGITNVKAAPLSYLSDNLFSDWSPDGRRLVYVSRRGEVRTPGWESVIIRDLESGTERVIPTLLTIGHPRWSPDGQRIILPADGPQGPGNYLLSLADGSIQPLLLASRRPNFPSWMPDGRTMLYLWRGGTTPTIHSLDMSTRSTRPLVPDAGKFVISRNGDRIAFVTETHRPYGRVVVWERRTNTRLELGREERDTGLDVVGWSPDDAEIVLARYRGRETDTDLIAFPSRGGPARPVGSIAAELARSVRLNPAGTRISFEAGTGDWTAWVMRGFVETGRAGQ